MKNKPTLSISSYYGGKGRMAHFMADRLNYDCEVFVTPFGGMCRELLNKPRHHVECYNDYSSGLCALMTVLSDRDKADVFIHRLYEETDFSEEMFLKHKAVYDSAEGDLEEQEREKLRQLLIADKVIGNHYPRAKLEEILLKSFDVMTDMQAAEKEKETEFNRTLYHWVNLYKVKQQQGFLPRPADMGVEISEMDLAIATYVTFKMSRDGMGKTFSKEKFKTTDQYHAQVLNLYECAERLEGVNIFQLDAMDFFRHWRPDGDMSHTPYFDEWLNDPNVMMYCDPSYISPDSEQKLLEGINIDKEDCLSDAIQKMYDGRKWPKNLGEIYARSFGYVDQERFLQCIQNAKCSMMVSNYDLALYNKYLNERTGWRREEFITTTSVGGKMDNSRTEVIWYNY